MKPASTAAIRAQLRSARTVWCPGCSNGIITRAIIDAVLGLELDADKVAVFAGIGCSGRITNYLNYSTVHCAHGRALPFATGAKVADPALKVIVVMGDGDCAAIGGNHLIHAARRNVDLTIICINNFNYGMTGGQAGPTTPQGAVSTTTVYVCWDRPFNLPYLAHAVGATFVARWTTLHVRQLKEAMLRAMQKRGFAFIEVISPCPTGFGRPNRRGEGIEEMRAYRRRCVVDHHASLAEVGVDMTADDSPIVVGNFHDVDRPPFRPVAVGPARPVRSGAEWATVRWTRENADDDGTV